MIVNNIKYINPPKLGGKYGSIKGADGTTIMVPPDLLGYFRLGMSCEVNVKQQTWGQGTADERLVTIATSGPTQGNTGPIQGQGVQAGYQGASQAAANYRPNTGFQPRVIQGGPAQPEEDKSRHIFVCGVVQQAMSSGKFTASEIPVLTQSANEAFDMIRPRPRPAPGDQGYSRPALEQAPPLIEPGDPGPELQ